MIQKNVTTNEANTPNDREIVVLKETFPSSFMSDGSFDIEHFKGLLNKKVQLKLIENDEPNKLDNTELIALLNIYEQEWIHRDNIFWANSVKFFLASLITTLVPYLYRYFYLDLPSVNMLIFPIFGTIMALIFLFISLSYAVRLQAAGNTVQNLIDMLDYRYQRVRVLDIIEKKKRFEKNNSIKLRIQKKLYSARITRISSWMLFLFLLSLAIFVIITLY